MTDEPTISAAIIVEEGKLLLVQRRIKEGELSWQFPAGAVEPGESLEDAAVRETKEETDLTVTARALLGERVHPKTGRRMAYVACTRVTGTARVADEEELAAFAWVSADEFDTFVPYGFAPMVTEYLDSVGITSRGITSS